MKQKSIHSLIYGNYLKSALIPILVIEVTLLLLYFGINYYISEKNRSTLLSEATKNIEEIASREVLSINRQLEEISDLAVIMQRDHQAFFSREDSCFLPNREPRFAGHDNGAYYKTTDNGGGSLYYSATTKIGPTEMQKARCSEMLDPLLISIVETNDLVTQAYLNTWDDMNRLYPFMPDAPAQYGPAIHMEDYNFYYDADTAHNPQRKPVWTGAYLDPAGQGWMISVIVPVYRGDFLEGVSGLDVTIDAFVQHILNLKIPWGAGTFMVDDSGTILAMQDRVEKIFNLKELGPHQYTENIMSTVEKPEDFNVLKSHNEAIRAQFTRLFDSGERITSMTIDGVDYLVSQEIIDETGWRMLTMIGKTAVFAPITSLKQLSNRVGLIAIVAMLLFYALFFAFLLISSKKLTSKIALPIAELSERTKELGHDRKAGDSHLSGIDEVDNLVRNFDTMSRKLNAAMHEANDARNEADSVISDFLDSLIVVGPDARITRVNKETSLLLGYPEDELIGRQACELFADDPDKVKKAFKFPFIPETAAKSELRNIEMTLVAADGTKQPVSVNLARLTNFLNETIGVIAGAKDISDLKQAVDQAKQQSQFIQNILNTVPGGLLVFNHESRLVQSNETYDQLLKDWNETYGFSGNTLENQILKTLADIRQYQPIGSFTLNGDKEELIIEYHASKSEAQNAQHDQVVFLRDVTSRHKAETNRKLQATVLEQTSDGVIVFDTEGIIQYGNLASEHMSGWPVKDLYGINTTIFRSGIHEDEFYSELWKTLLSGKVWRGALTNRRRDGSLFDTETTISPVRSSEGTITHYVSLWRDVSHERTLQRQLLQAQKLEAVGQLAAGVAHEINTPLQYIQNNLSFFKSSFEDIAPLLDELQNTLDQPENFANPDWQVNLTRLIEAADLDFVGEEMIEGVNDALGGVDHVTRIVAALKEFSHPGGGGKAATNLNHLIDSASIVTRNEWKYVSELKTDLDPELPSIFCETGAISQILFNLIVNAADAIREKNDSTTPGEIRITTKTVANAIMMTVSDNGAGIRDDIKDRIFEPFFTTKEVGKGSGQGLSIVYDIVVKKHQGSIKVDSTEGVGTTMTITLPI